VPQVMKPKVAYAGLLQGDFERPAKLVDIYLVAGRIAENVVVAR
jgi:hypothetical protein